MLRGRASVAIARLPNRGLARGLKGIEAEVGGETLELVGATFSISGKPYDRLKWRVEKDSINATLFASIRDAEITEEYLQLGFQIALEGFDKFLIEKQP